MTQFQDRVAEHEIEKLFLERWSPRAFTSEAMPPGVLKQLFEAARWAPSSYNSQPWRYVYAHRDTEAFATILSLLVEFNQSWAKHAAVLVIAISKETMRPPGQDKDVPSWSHSFDAGSAWENIALQATALGWHTHGMVGFDRDRAVTELKIPAGYRVEAAIAIGRQGDKSTLPEMLQAREAPSDRNKVETFAFEGVFAA